LLKSLHLGGIACDIHANLDCIDLPQQEAGLFFDLSASKLVNARVVKLCQNAPLLVQQGLLFCQEFSSL
jgi:hypothetical protein